MHEFLHLLVDPAHWGFEAVSDLVFAGAAGLFGSLFLRRHDRRHHGDQHDHRCHAESGIHGCELGDRHPGPHRCLVCGNWWSLDDDGHYHRHPRTHSECPGQDITEWLASRPVMRGDWTER